MSKKNNYNKQLKELIKAKKADEEILAVYERYEEELEDKMTLLKGKCLELNKLENQLEGSKNVKSKVPVYKVKAYKFASNNLKEIQKQYNIALNEQSEIQDQMLELVYSIAELENEIELQYNIFQENEIYVQAVKKIEENNIEVLPRAHKNYTKYIKMYELSKFSLKKDTRIVRPNLEDLQLLLNILKKSEEPKVTKKRGRPAKKKEGISEVSSDEKKAKKSTSKKAKTTAKTTTVTKKAKKAI